VIVTHGCGLADFVGQREAGIVTDATVESLHAALTRMLSDGALRLAMGQSGRRAARQELSLEAFGTRLESLYRAVLADGPRRAPTSLPLLKS
jgi:glycosyltransferase involved in cell wall biosynthesis